MTTKDLRKLLKEKYGMTNTIYYKLRRFGDIPAPKGRGDVRKEYTDKQVEGIISDLDKTQGEK